MIDARSGTYRAIGDDGSGACSNAVRNPTIWPSSYPAIPSQNERRSAAMRAVTAGSSGPTGNSG